ncbi:MAG: zinc ribbon domain-containing protein [Acidobacteria bacterium]|nr:zinc ribbon domain-containing protein [Acidobacteriota bacterium]
MPIYEYRCPSCGHKFELLRRVSDDDREIRCPQCEAGEVQREFSVFCSSGDVRTGASGCAPSGGRFT